MKIRKAELEDKEQVMGLVRKFYGRDPKKMINKWGRNYQEYIDGTFIVDEGNKLVAYITFGIKPKEDAVYIGDLYVSPKFRRKGLAKALVQVADNARKNLNKKYLTLDVTKTNYSARKLYEKLGFEFWKLKGKDSIKLRK